MIKKILQTRLIWADNSDSLEDDINKALVELKNYPIMDIKFMGYSQDSGATRAMIVFEDEIEAEEEAGN